MVVDDAVKAAVQLVKPVTGADLRKTLRGISRAQRQFLVAQVRKSMLLPIEEAAIVALDKRIGELDAEMQSGKTHLLHLLKCHPYPRLSFEPLSWRNDQKAPRLAVFQLDSPRFALVAEASLYRTNGKLEVTLSCDPKLPGVIQQCYADVFALLRVQAERTQKTVKLTAKFSGVIPEKVKQRIAHARSVFSSIFILAEVGTWSLTEEALTKVDPLVVGFADESFWLIDTFDTTPLEEYVRREFRMDP